MIYSIRKFLLINLLLSVTLITSLAILGNLLLEHRQFKNHLDAQLTESAFLLEAFIAGHDNATIASLQPRIDMMTQNIHHTRRPDNPNRIRSLTADVEFKVWTDDGYLLLNSESAPDFTLEPNQEIGFHDLWAHKQSWRSFSLYLPIQKLHIMVFQSHSYRVELEKQVTEDSITIMLISYPFLGILIWIIVGRGLETLSHVTRELRKRSNDKLTKLTFKNIPEEIEPLVNELNSLFDRLEQSFDREKRFAADAAHELRTPLAALYTQIQIAQQIEDVDKLQKINTKLVDGIKRCTHIVEQLLCLSKSISSLDPRQCETTNIGKMVQQTLADYGHVALEKDIKIELINNAEQQTVFGNCTTLAIMFRNLIDNAIRYSHEHGEIKVVITNQSEKSTDGTVKNPVIIRIIDSGPGLTEEQRTRVFERFYRVVGSQRDGSGLGLSIVYQIVKYHHGCIELRHHNEFSSGLEARICLPLVVDATTQKQKTKKSRPCDN